MSKLLSEPDILLDPSPTPEIPLPKGWSALTLRTILHVITFAALSFSTRTTGLAAPNATVCVYVAKMIGFAAKSTC